jgi:hypothetical protein
VTDVYDDTDEDEYVPSGINVVLPSGLIQPVRNFAEQKHLQNQVALYGEHNQLTNIADLAELDRLLILEMMSYRFGNWLGRGKDYEGEEINEKVVNDQLNSASTEIRLVKKNLGLDRPARERASGQGSVAHYWEQLRVRAQAFAINRNNMSAKAIELAMQAISLIQVHDNCADEAEREKLHCTQDEIMRWWREVSTPEFRAIDAHFRETAQTYWIRDQ